jgi:MFS family permease
VNTPPLSSLQADPLVRRLALTLFATNLLAQAGAALLVALWAGQVTQTPRMLGLIAVAFMLGLLGAGVTFAGLTRNANASVALALGGLVGGAAGYLFLLSRPPALLLVVAAALVTGVATASVIPLTGTLLSVHVPPELKSKVDGLLASVSYLGIPFGTVAAAWFLPRATAFSGLAAAAGAYLVAMLIPVFVFRPWRQLLPGANRLPARLTVTLAYANGQWIVEVRRGRALLGSRHLVKSAEAMNMLAVLDVPGVQDSVEKALVVDQVEATRQADRMRQELAELEARLAGLTEMVEITENHRPTPTPKPREADREPEDEVAK